MKQTKTSHALAMNGVLLLPVSTGCLTRRAKMISEHNDAFQFEVHHGFVLRVEVAEQSWSLEAVL